MLARLASRLRRAWQSVRAAAGDEATITEQLRELRERALDESALLAQDREALAQRVRRNAQRGRSLLGGERPL